MTDDYNSRYRPSDPYGRPPAQNGQGGDPLAELARLIGQNDPFSEFGRNTPGAPSHDPRYDAAPQPQQYVNDPAPTHWQQPAAAAHAPHDYDPFAATAPQPPISAQPHYESHPYAEEQPQQGYNGYHQEPPQQALNGYHQEPPQQALNGYHPDPAQPANGYHPEQQQAYNQPAYGSPGYEASAHQQADPGYAAAYQNRGQMPSPHQDDFYEDAPSGRRKGFITVAAVLSLAVIGTAGAFAYRNMFNGPGSFNPLRIIPASLEPNRVAPPPSNNEASNKLTYDRLNTPPGQAEQVVPREEQPVDINTLARATPPAAPAPSAAATPGTPPSALGDPKRVRTERIRAAADQPVDVVPRAQATAPRPPTLASASPNPQVEAPPPQQNTAPPPATIRRPTAPRVPAAAAPPPASADAPLSLSPNSNGPLPAPAARDASAVPRPPARARVAAAVTGVNGNFLVQVSSQRTEAEAQTSFRGLQSKYSNVLAGQHLVVRRADLGDKGVYYRAMVGPFASRDQAVQLCGSLKAAGGDCVVQGSN